MMRPQLYERVALKADLPQHRLKAGDVVVLLDYVSHPKGGDDGAVVEVFNALGQSITVATVAASQLEPLTADEVLAVRLLAGVG
jgi:hypothetical protein